MSTFFGGEQLTDVLTFRNYFTPSDNQEFNIYTVPVGSYALIKRFTIQSKNNDSSFAIEVRHLDLEINVGSGAQIDYDRVIADASQPIDDQLNLSRNSSFEDYYLEAGDSLRFHNRTGSNQPTTYFIVLHVYKKA